MNNEELAALWESLLGDPGLLDRRSLRSAFYQKEEPPTLRQFDRAVLEDAGHLAHDRNVSKLPLADWLTHAQALARKSEEVASAADASTSDETEQRRQHGLAAAGLGAAPIDKQARAKELREQQTRSERVLGQALAALRWEFFAQVPRHGYILDFYAPAVSLGVEVDGSSHDGMQVRDSLRDDVLRAHGIEVLRFTAREVLTRTSQVRVRIKETARRRVGQSDWQEWLDAEWDVWRHGPDRVDADEPSGDETDPPRGPRVFPGRWKCLQCDREFVAPVIPRPSCREDRRHKVRAVCSVCKQPTAERPHLCRRCQDARDVARESAGPGARIVQGELRQAKRARRYKG